MPGLNGRRVAVAIRDAAHGQNLDLRVMDSARGRSSRITSESTDEFGPAWFPDGERIAFQSNRSGRMEIWTMNSDGTELMQVTGRR